MRAPVVRAVTVTTETTPTRIERGEERTKPSLSHAAEGGTREDQKTRISPAERSGGARVYLRAVERIVYVPIRMLITRLAH